MKFLKYQFDASILLLVFAFGVGLAVSSSGCVESESESVSHQRPITIGSEDSQTDGVTTKPLEDYSSNS